jgi:O-antigen/teichoic acid export membrane protein
MSQPRLFRQTILYLPAQVVGPFSQMAAAFIWTHWMTPDALGAYAIIIAVQELTYLLVLSWWSSYVQRFVTTHDGADESERLDQMEASIQLLAGLAQTVLVVAALAIAFNYMVSADLVIATIVFTLTRNLTTHFAWRARARFETIAFTLLQAVGPTLGLVFGLFAVSLIAATPAMLLWSYALAQVLGLIMSLPLMRFEIRSPQVDWRLFERAWGYGAPLLLAAVLAWVSVQGIRFIVEYEQGAAAVGLVTVGWWLGLRLTAFSALLVTGASFNVAVEQVREAGDEGALPQFATNGALLLAILVPSVIGAFLLNKFIVLALVAEPYREITTAILPLSILAGALHAFRDHGSDQPFLVFARTKLAALSTGLEAVLTVVMCWAGLRLDGVYGAVAGCAIAAAIAMVFSFALARTLFGYYLRWSDLGRIAIATVIMTLAQSLMPDASSLTRLVLEISICAGVYFAALGALYPAVSQHAIDIVRARLVRREV